MSKSRTSQQFKFPYVATVVAFLAIVIMLGLGFWQLERKSEKDQRISNIKLAAASELLQFGDIVKNITNYQDYHVQLNGQPMQQFFYIDNKLRNGRAGYHVLMPYKTNDGIVIVNLGWLSATGVRAELPNFKITSEHSVKGQVYLPTNNKLITETNHAYGDFPVLLQQVDLIEIEKHLGTTVLPITIRLLDEKLKQENESSSNFVREWQAITMAPEKHLAYAIQWFGLAVAALTIYLLSMAKRVHGPSPNGSDTSSNR